MNRFKHMIQRYRPVSVFTPSEEQYGLGASDNAYEGLEFQKGYGYNHDPSYICCNPVSLMGGRRFRQRGGSFGMWRIFKNVGPMIGNWFSKAAPAIKTGLTSVGNKMIESAKDALLTSGTKLLDDVVAGENVIKSVKKRVKEGSKAFTSDATSKLVSSGLEIASAAKKKLSEKLNQKGSGLKRTKRSATDVGTSASAKRKKVIHKSAIEEKGHRFGKIKLAYRHIFQ